MATPSELRQGWPAIAACFATAVFGWGFGLYGQSVLVAGLQASRGWSAFLVSSASSFYYLAGAILIAFTPRAIARFGPRRIILAGAIALGLGATLTANATAPWQMFAGSLLMALGWGWTSTSAIAATLALWFDTKRGLAISLALNGASASGFTAAPLLVFMQQAIGLDRAVPVVAIAMFLLLAPLLIWGTSRPWRDGARPGTPSPATRASLRDPRIWRVAGPFALALMAQVAMLVHLVALLLPRIGTAGAGMGVALVSLMAMAGRLGVGAVIDRLDLRRVAAISLLTQAASLALMLTLPGAAWAQYAGCIGFGLSVGNIITLPSLLIQREFPPAAFGAAVGLSTAIGQFAYAFAPGLAGLVHDLAGGYGPVLALCMALQLGAVALVLRGQLPLNTPT